MRKKFEKERKFSGSQKFWMKKFQREKINLWLLHSKIIIEKSFQENCSSEQLKFNFLEKAYKPF